VLVAMGVTGYFAWMGGVEASVDEKNKELREMEKLREDAWAGRAQSSRP
jgi:hypothetical protein